VVFLPQKTTPHELYGVTVIVKPLRESMCESVAAACAIGHHVASFSG